MAGWLQSCFVELLVPWSAGLLAVVVFVDVVVGVVVVVVFVVFVVVLLVGVD